MAFALSGSAAKRSDSSGVGGRPVRLNVARRSQIRGSAGLAAAIWAALSLALMKLSIDAFVAGLRRHKRPKCLLLGRDLSDSRLDLLLLFRPGKANPHPLFQIRNFFLGKGAHRRHLEAHVSPFHGLNQETGFGFPFDDGFPGFAAFQNAFTRIEPQVAERAVTGVAGMAVRRKKRSNFRLKEIVAVGCKQRKSAYNQRHE